MDDLTDEKSDAERGATPHTTAVEAADSNKPAPGVSGRNGSPTRIPYDDAEGITGGSGGDSAGGTGGEANTEYVEGIRLVFILLSVSLACFLVLLDTSIVSTAVPKITDDFHSLRDVGWYASSYSLGSVALQLLTGKIYHYFSLKWSFIAFFAVFELGSALSGAAQSSAMFIISRAVSGIGASGLINGALTILAASVPLERRPPLTGICMGVAQLGVICGPLIGGAFTSGYTWRWCFYINLPLGSLVALPLLMLRIPDQFPKQPPLSVLRRLPELLDLVGFALFAPAVVMLLLALQYGGNQYAWRSSQVIGLFCGSGATCIVWLVWNYRKGDAALLPVSIVRRQRVWTSGIYYMLLSTTLIGASYFLPIYFQAVKGVSAIMSGVYLLATIIPQVLGAVSSGILVSRVGYVPPFAIFGAVLFTTGSGLYSLFQPGTTTGQWIGFQILNGLGRGLGFQMAIVAVQNAVSPTELAPGMAFIIWCQYLGPTIFLTVFNTVFDARLLAQLKIHAAGVNPGIILQAGATGFRKVIPQADVPGVLQAYSNGFDVVFYIVAGLSAVSVFVAAGMGWNDIRQPKTTPAAEKAVLPSDDSTMAPGDEKRNESQTEV
ncbi:Major facilitator superfamily domain, general substrate transporter [Niveomyces insectorum RCEF 264]|uniref:Major facilitator superfamily domain, general substrate transporter n=1 Tax=Niveomyces insectorum RCEF 264 TaxID=1081102 RepID=A0A167UPJ2_9HYPO|nr:Major facilitator superfamily domain, general substrate transporter [Niveomyces insectorum RCEF 264]